MSASPADRRRRRCAAFSAGLYVLFLLVVPFSHHDLACHLKTPQHCTACTSTTVAAGPYVASIPEFSSLVDAGQPAVFEVEERSAMLAARASGRSPPARS